MNLDAYESCTAAAKRLRLTRPGLVYYLRTGRIPGALKQRFPGGAYAVWLIPKDAVLPPRRRPGRPRGRKLVVPTL